MSHIPYGGIFDCQTVGEDCASGCQVFPDRPVRPVMPVPNIVIPPPIPLPMTPPQVRPLLPMTPPIQVRQFLPPPVRPAIPPSKFMPFRPLPPKLTWPPLRKPVRPLTPPQLMRPIMPPLLRMPPKPLPTPGPGPLTPPMLRIPPTIRPTGPSLFTRLKGLVDRLRPQPPVRLGPPPPSVALPAGIHQTLRPMPIMKRVAQPTTTRRILPTLVNQKPLLTQIKGFGDDARMPRPVNVGCSSDLGVSIFGQNVYDYGTSVPQTPDLPMVNITGYLR